MSWLVHWQHDKFDPDQSSFTSLPVVEKEGQKNCQSWLQKECQAAWSCQTKREDTKKYLTC